MADASQARQRGNVELLRVCAAIAVVGSHAVLVTAGSAFWAPQGTHVSVYRTLGSDAVCVFFVLSGYLVAKSWRRDPHVGRYLARRALRIFPGLWVAVLALAIPFGLLVTSLPRTAYAGGSGPFAFVLNGLLYPDVQSLPGVFASSPNPSVVDGSLWSLRYEFTCYVAVVIVFALASLLRTRRFPLYIVALALVGRLALPLVGWTPDVGTVHVWLLCALVAFFFAGASWDQWARRVPMRRSLAIGAGAVAFALSCIASFDYYQPGAVPWWEVLEVPAATYAVMYFALAERSVAPTVWRRADLSYGIYIYGFPIEQAVAALMGPHASAFAVFVVALPMTAAVAALSWRFIEKPALRLKPGAARSRERVSGEPHALRVELAAT